MQILAIFPSNLRAQSALTSLNLIAQRNVPNQQQLNALSKLFHERDFAAVLASTRVLLTRTIHQTYWNLIRRTRLAGLRLRFDRNFGNALGGILWFRAAAPAAFFTGFAL